MNHEKLSIVAPVVGADTDIHDAIETARKANALAVVQEHGGQDVLHLVDDLQSAVKSGAPSTRLASLNGRVLLHGERLSDPALGGIAELAFKPQDLVARLGTYYVCPKDNREVYSGPGKCRRHNVALIRKP